MPIFGKFRITRLRLITSLMSNENKKWRRTREYRVWKASVIRRDKRCVVCDSIKNRQAHHKNHASYFKEERYDVENGVTLCHHCHIQYHCNYHRSFRQKCTKYSWSNFLSLLDYIVKLDNNDRD